MFTPLPSPRLPRVHVTVIRAGRALGLLAVAAVLAACIGGQGGPSTLGADRAGPRPDASGAPVPPATSAAASRGTFSAVTAADWPMYHLNSGRTGDYQSFPAFTGVLTPGWSTALDGAVYAEPLVVNGTVFAATEGDSVYALDATSGAVLWRRHVGTPVPLSSLPCGNIDPLGITSTPVYDSVTGSLFAVAEMTGAGAPQHVLYALDPATGAVLWSRNVDPSGDDPATHQQRGALAVANGYVYFGFGGLAGDCGQYVGEVIGVPASGSGATISYRVPTSREGAVWSTGGPVVDGSGNLYVSVGNGASTTTYDGTDSVLELSPSLSLLSRFAPSVWAHDNATDSDLGSLSPVLVPGGYVFIAGKNGNGYVLHQGALGGIGGQISTAGVCTGFGGASQSGATIYVPCEGSIRMVTVGAGGSLTPGWESGAAGAPPVLGGGAVWAVNVSSGHLVALNPATGSTMGSISIGAVPHFASPTLWNDRILVGTMAGIATVVVPSAPATPATFHALTPARLLDTRDGTGGISGRIGAHSARTFQVTGGIVPAGASAVTGVLTVTGQSGAGYLFVGPNPMDYPLTSTLNFPVGDDRANGVTVSLGTNGTLAVTYAAAAGKQTNVIFDVTGYFTPDATGATFHAIGAAARLLDTRNGTGGIIGPIPANRHQTFQVTGGVVPAGATAVTGNLTVTGQTGPGYLFIGPNPLDNPSTSTLNFPLADTRADGATVELHNDGTLSVTYAAANGRHTHVIFDVTGYFTPDATGSTFHSLSPSRILDTRDGTGGILGAIASHSPGTFAVTSGVVPAGAVAITGNLTVTGQTAGGYLFLGPSPLVNPTTSTLNFPVGDNRANGMTAGLGSGGHLSVTYVSAAGKHANVIVDVTGYYGP
jgi:outer membrane protein assembly factor BamB